MTKDKEYQANELANRRISEMQDAELLKYLRETVNSMSLMVDRLEVLANQKEGPDAGQDSA